MIENNSLSIIIPVYNEAGIIEKMLRDYHAEIADKFKEHEIIVVNDCSTDNTSCILEGLKKELELLIIDLPRNLGHGGALLKGFERAKNNLVFHADSDYQLDPKDFWKLYENIENNDAVIGYRENRKNTLIRMLLSSFIGIFNRFLFGVSLKDANVPFKLYKKRMLDSILPLLKNNILAPSIFINLLASRLPDRQAGSKAGMGYKIKEVPVSHYKRSSGKSSLSGLKLARFCFVSLLQLIEFRKSWK